MIEAGAMGTNDKIRDYFHDMLGISRLTEKEHDELEKQLEEQRNPMPAMGNRPGNPKTNQDSMQRPSQQNQRQGTERKT